MYPTLKDKVALVTGSGRGIGRAIALKLAAHGARVVVNDLDTQPAEDTAAEIRAAGGEAAVCAGSVTAPDFAERLVGTAKSHYGSVDIIINNAGYTWDSVIQKMTDEQWYAMIDCHLTAPFRILRAAQPFIRELAKADAEAGRRTVRKVVNISSVAGLFGNAGQVNYSTAKAGIVGMTQTLAKEWGRFGVTVNAVAFGLIHTRLTHASDGNTANIDGRDIKVGVNPDLLATLERTIPLGHAGSPEDAAGAVYLLCLPESDYVSGQTLMCSGGLTGSEMQANNEQGACGPLAGVRVIDLTTVLMGPFATQILGDFGADVIKVEPPGGGDGVRGVGPRRNPGMAAIFLHANRSKRSVVLDLKHPDGREALLRLAADADVLIYNVRPQAMARLALSYEDVAAVNPKIIYVGTYGYSQRGPYAAKPAYDDLIQGAVGIPALSVLAGGDQPRYAPSPMADRICGLAAVNAVTAALYWRERSGEGQSIEVPMFETMAQFTLSDHMCGETFDPPLGPTGYARVLNEYRRPYATRDGYLCVLPYSDKQWETFFRVVGRPELLQTDPRFSSLERRTEHIRELYSLLAEIMLTRTTAEWRECLEAVDIPVMPMHSIDSLMDDPHLKAVGFLQTVDHPTEGRMRSIGIPSSWSKSQPRLTRHAPRAGEHGREVLAEAGYSSEEIDALAASGAMSVPVRS